MADCTAGAELLERMPRCRILHGDKGYDSDAIRRQIQGPGRCRTSRPRRTDAGRIAFARPLSGRKAIERMFCRLKDFRRIATRYDRFAINFLAAVCIAAMVSYWL